MYCEYLHLYVLNRVEVINVLFIVIKSDMHECAAHAVFCSIKLIKYIVSGKMTDVPIRGIHSVYKYQLEIDLPLTLSKHYNYATESFCNTYMIKKQL